MSGSGVRACALPPGALLRRYREQGDYTDCYSLFLAHGVSQEQYVRAFYTTAVFRLERLILRWAIRRPSSDAEAAALAQGRSDRFAAWTVEQRGARQLLLCDLHGRTRSWLMSQPEGAGTRLYFGSAVVRQGQAQGKAGLPPLYAALLGFHRIYSRVLLSAAGSALGP